MSHAARWVGVTPQSVKDACDTGKVINDAKFFYLDKQGETVPDPDVPITLKQSKLQRTQVALEVLQTASRRDIVEVTQWGLEHVKEWIAKEAEHSPRSAFNMLAKLLPYTMPTLSRSETMAISAKMDMTNKERDDLMKTIAKGYIKSGHIDITQYQTNGQSQADTPGEGDIQE